MQGENSADRRIFGRIPAKLPIRFLASGEDREFRGKTVDISANGIGLLSEEGLPLQAPLEIWLDLPNGRGPFYTRGEVVWSSASDEAKRQRLGIRLEKAELMGLAPVLWG